MFLDIISSTSNPFEDNEKLKKILYEFYFKENDNTNQKINLDKDYLTELHLLYFKIFKQNLNKINDEDIKENNLDYNLIKSCQIFFNRQNPKDIKELFSIFRMPDVSNFGRISNQLKNIITEYFSAIFLKNNYMISINMNNNILSPFILEEKLSISNTLIINCPQKLNTKIIYEFTKRCNELEIPFSYSFTFENDNFYNSIEIYSNDKYLNVYADILNDILQMPIYTNSDDKSKIILDEIYKPNAYYKSVNKIAYLPHNLNNCRIDLEYKLANIFNYSIYRILSDTNISDKFMINSDNNKININELICQKLALCIASNMTWDEIWKLRRSYEFRDYFNMPTEKPTTMEEVYQYIKENIVYKNYYEFLKTLITKKETLFYKDEIDFIKNLNQINNCNIFIPHNFEISYNKFSIKNEQIMSSIFEVIEQVINNDEFINYFKHYINNYINLYNHDDTITQLR